MNSALEKRESVLVRFWPLLLVGTAWLWLFWPMMIGETVVGFRDSAYLYYPLFKWIDAQWAAGEIPLWNPYCNLGMPVVGDGTSSVFYPGKLVFFCWFLSYPARYGIYLAIHVPIAAAGTYWFSRSIRANRAGATLAAFSFAFGGSVLFQTTNVIYLVSAAWLPFAVCCVWKMIKTGQYRWAVAAGVFCALMILGGDPQMVYHVGLLALAAIVGEFIRKQQRRVRTRSTIKKSASAWVILRAVPLLAVMVVVTSLLAAIQLLPTYTWSKLSERTNPEVPANIYGTFLGPKGYLEAQDVKALLGEPILTIEHSYQFSQPPWSVSELFWPNISGKPFPKNQRWTSGLPGADRVWVPSLYMGLLTVVLAISGMRFWGRSRKRVWLTWAMLFFLIASFGWYGPVWLANEFIPIKHQSQELGSQVGGLYWFMNMVLPKYFAFRYPAKLFLVASLGVSVLAGLSLRQRRMKPVGIMAMGMAALSGVGIYLFQKFGIQQLEVLSSDLLFGPFDISGATQATKVSLIQTALAGLIVATVAFLIWFREKRNSGSAFLLVALVAVTGFEVVFANAWLLPQVSSEVFESPSPIQKKLAELKLQSNSVAPLRIYRSPRDFFEPQIWSYESSENRLAEIVEWQRSSLYPKQHLGEEVVLMGSFSSVWPGCYETYMDYFEFSRAWESRKNGSYVPYDFRFYEHSFEIDVEGNFSLDPFSPNPSCDLTCPVEWMHELNPTTNRPTSLDAFWTNDPDEPLQNYGDKKRSKIVEFECNRFVAHVSTDQPRVLVFSTASVNGWTANVRRINSSGEVESLGEDVKLILKTDLVNRKTRRNYFDGLLLPFSELGEYEVEFVYSPIEFWIGMWISGVSWLILTAGFVWWRRKRR